MCIFYCNLFIKCAYYTRAAYHMPDNFVEPRSKQNLRYEKNIQKVPFWSSKQPCFFAADQKLYFDFCQAIV